MPGSGLHRQVKVLWRNHRLGVNIWGPGRESSPATGSLLPGQAGSAFSNVVVSVLGILLAFLRCWVGMFFAPFRCFMGSLGSVLLGSAFSLMTYLRGTLVKRLCSHSLFWRWRRSRHKRIRGIGSQAESRRGAKSRLLALAFKARSFFGSDVRFSLEDVFSVPLCP